MIYVHLREVIQRVLSPIEPVKYGKIVYRSVALAPSADTRHHTGRRPVHFSLDNFDISMCNSEQRLTNSVSTNMYRNFDLIFIVVINVPFQPTEKIRRFLIRLYLSLFIFCMFVSI